MHGFGTCSSEQSKEFIQLSQPETTSSTGCVHSWQPGQMWRLSPRKDLRLPKCAVQPMVQPKPTTASTRLRGAASLSRGAWSQQAQHTKTKAGVTKQKTMEAPWTGACSHSSSTKSCSCSQGSLETVGQASQQLERKPIQI